MRRADQIRSVVLLGSAGYVVIEAWRLDFWSAPRVPGPGFLPLLLGMSLGVGAVGILLEGARTKTPAARWFARWDSAVRFLVLAGFVAAFVAAITPLGMLVAVGVFLLGFLAIYLSGRWLTVLFIAAGTPLGLYLIFERWLKLLLPRSLLGF